MAGTVAQTALINGLIYFKLKKLKVESRDRSSYKVSHGDSAQDVRAWFERRKYVPTPALFRFQVKKLSTDMVLVSRECGPLLAAASQ